MVAIIAVLLQAAIPTPPVDINHIYITVDRKTWDAISSSKWLKDEFAGVSVSTHSDGRSTWTGCYVYGGGTYLEIFSPHADFKEGKAGIGFSTNTPGGADNIDYNFRKGYFGNRTERELMNIGSRKGKLKPFAHIVSYTGQDDSNLSVWLMEFHEEYFRDMGAPVGSSPAATFEAYRKRINEPPSKLMRNITSVTVHPPNGDLAQALRLFGYGESANGKWVRGSNELQLRPRASYAITSVRMSLRTAPKRAHTERFGKRSYLRVMPNGSAEWRF